MYTAQVISKGEGYNTRHLRHSDHIDPEKEVEGLWAGKGSERLGLQGTVQEYQFEAVRTGTHPETWEQLRPRILDLPGARHLYDFTVSAPKSVSVLACTEEDGKLRRAHEKAVVESLAELETFAQSRVRAGGKNESRPTENLVVGVFHHDTSRSLDPQLHTHCVAANMTWDAVEKRWKALEARGIYDNLRYISEVYRSVLANEVRHLGYEIEVAVAGRRNFSFEISGVSKEVREKLSQRSDDRDRAMAEFRAERGRAPTNNETAILVRGSRPDKLERISGARVRELQREKLEAHERQALHELRERSHRRGPLPKTVTAAASLAHVRETLFERVSVASRSDVLTEALIHGRGHVNHEHVKALFEAQVKEGVFLSHGGLVTTRENVLREDAMVTSVNQGVGRSTALGYPMTGLSSLSVGQEYVVSGVLNSRDRVIGIDDYGSDCRSEVIGKIKAEIEVRGHKALVMGPNGRTVDALRKEGFKDAKTVDQFIDEHWSSKPLRGTVVVADAHLLGAKEMSEIVKLTQDLESRLVLYADSKQVGPFSAGDAFKQLQRDSSMKTLTTFDHHRQSGVFKNALEALRQSGVEGFKRLNNMRVIHEVRSHELYSRAAKHYAKLNGRVDAVNRAKAPSLFTRAKGIKEDPVIAVTPSKNVAGLNRAIRSELKASGQLGRGKTVKTLTPVHMTSAQKRDARNYRPGMYLSFHKATRGAKVNEVFKVKAVRGDKIVATRGVFKSISLTKKQAQAFSVFERSQLEVAKGEKLILGKTSKSRAGRLFSFESKFRAGEKVTVKGFDLRGRIALTDGRTLPKDYKEFTHAYAMTPLAAQGQRATHTIVAAERMTREAFYTAVSRGRQGADIFTLDKKELAQSVTHNIERLSALELAHDKQQAQMTKESQAKDTAQAQGTEQARAVNG